MDEETQQRLETVLAAGMGIGLSRLVTQRLVEDLVPERRGIKDDVLRAVLKGGTTAVSTILASLIVRRAARGRWGT